MKHSGLGPGNLQRLDDSNFAGGWLALCSIDMRGGAAGIIVGTAMIDSLSFSTSVFRLQIGELALPCYAALACLVVNLAVAVALTFVLNVIHTARGRDDTIEADYQEATS
ncbi:hypothetical protein [Bradyrhizobium sp.]|uniref:hypothetical protein n=1 Tax=Bradyrhizobium sp. TaxID=376 RepID=UPI002D01370C|nr:hypothetical protein [Bradyrhizobium sp.]HMM87602.1 hypothetical protein [Bradyrhizobium sp.]